VSRSTVLGLLFVLLIGPGASAAPLQLAWPDLDGVIHDVERYRGQWVVVNYWASWCPPCIVEIPELIEFHDRHVDNDAVVLGVNIEGGSTASIQAFAERMGVTYPVLIADPSNPGAYDRVPGLPTTYIIRPDGELAARRTGPLTAVQLEIFIRSAGARPPVAEPQRRRL